MARGQGGPAAKAGRGAFSHPCQAQHASTAPVDLGARLKLLPLWIKNLAVQVGGLRGGSFLTLARRFKMSVRSDVHSRFCSLYLLISYASELPSQRDGIGLRSLLILPLTGQRLNLQQGIAGASRSKLEATPDEERPRRRRNQLLRKGRNNRIAPVASDSSAVVTEAMTPTNRFADRCL